MEYRDQQREALVRHLRKHLEGEVRFDVASCKLYSTDASIYQIEPLGVVIPKTVADLHTAVQIALEAHIPIVPRGGGTSLSGQSIGPGLVVDCSKYLNQIIHIDPERRTARVQVGVVLDQLNRALVEHGLQFGPDVATASRANLGGMIGNNSAGSHSIVNGKTIDHVNSLDVLLSDGSRATCGPLTAEQWRDKEPSGFVGGLYRGVRQIVVEAAPEIERRFPRIIRRVSGYNLDVFARGFTSGASLGLHQLIVGSEGTLGFVAEAELSLIHKPRAVGLLVPQFTTLAAAMDCLAICLEHQPSAVELLDHRLLELASKNLALKNTMSFLEGNPTALFMVEFSSDDELEVEDKVDKLRRRLIGRPGVIAALPAIDATRRNPLWNLRNAAVPLLLGLPGDDKPATFIEDTAVAPEHLPAFVARFRGILHKHGTDGTFYGHASVGCLHIRPLLNLKAPADVVRMRHITEDITDLLLEFGGSLSGEHGDGLVRSEWNRKMFGETVYEAFRKVKKLFDPHALFNPGKVVDAAPMTENLRYGPHYKPVEPPTLFDYSKQEGFMRSIELCNGAGVCRKTQGGTMCPSFRATLDEKDSTRGRANALRVTLSGEEPLKAVRERWVYDVLDLCLQCKACKAECPSNVDMAKLKAEFLQFYYDGRARPLSQRILGHVHQLNRVAAPMAPLVNFMQRNPFARWLMEKVTGIDRRRSLPTLHADHFRHWFARRKPAASSFERRQVLLLDDCFTTYNEPQIGRAAVEVLEAAGYDVALTGLECCGRALISKGFVREAKRLVEMQAPLLAARVAAGIPILGLEPSCLLTLTDEWPDLLPGAATQAIARAAKLADAWLAKNPGTLKLREHAETCVVHGHCHQKALVGMRGTADALSMIPGLDVRVLDTGCCGMAGSFGFEKYDLSATIANLDLLPALERTPDALVVAPGTSCRHQIHDLAKRTARHPLELLHGALM